MLVLSLHRAHDFHGSSSAEALPTMRPRVTRRHLALGASEWISHGGPPPEVLTHGSSYIAGDWRVLWAGHGHSGALHPSPDPGKIDAASDAQ